MGHQLSTIGFVSLLCVLTGACEALEGMSPEVREASATVEPAAAPATLRGSIVYRGAFRVPSDQAVAANEGRHHAEANKSDRSLLVDAHGGLANATIEVLVPGAEPAIPSEPLSLLRIDENFQPRVLLVPAGAEVSFGNSDECCNACFNLHAAKNPAVNRSVEPGASFSAVFPLAETIAITDDVHPWSKAFLRVTTSRFAAVTGTDGSFSFEGLPPGSYEVRVWHERMVLKRDRITLEPGQTRDLEIELRRPGE